MRTWNLFRNQIGFWFKTSYNIHNKNIFTEKNAEINRGFKVITVLNGCGTLLYEKK